MNTNDGEKRTRGRPGAHGRGPRRQGSSETLHRAQSEPRGVGWSNEGSTRDGGLEDAIHSLSGCGHTNTPAWQTLAEQTPSGQPCDPFGRERGIQKGRREHTGKGSASPCAPQPGWRKGARRSRLAGWKRSPDGSPISSASFPGPSPPSSAPPPARLAGSGRGEGPGKFVATSPSREPLGRQGAQVRARSLKAAALLVWSPGRLL